MRPVIVTLWVKRTIPFNPFHIQGLTKFNWSKRWESADKNAWCLWTWLPASRSACDSYNNFGGICHTPAPLRLYTYLILWVRFHASVTPRFLGTEVFCLRRHGPALQHHNSMPCAPSIAYNNIVSDEIYFVWRTKAVLRWVVESNSKPFNMWAAS